MTNLGRVLRVTALVVVAVKSTGCSVIGFATGAAIDSGKEDLDVDGVEVLVATPGVSVTAVLHDGERVSGRVADFLTGDGEAYGAAFASSRDRLPEHFIPRLGERVNLGTQAGLELHDSPALELAGVDRDCLVLRTETGARMVPWTDVPGVVGYRGVLQGEVLETLVSTGQVPTAEAISLRNGRTYTAVSFEDARLFSVSRDRNAKWAGLAVGAVIDAIVIVSVARMSFDLDFSGFGSGFAY